ncbi:metalloregulator ArsR/SmtB family transcription factor [Gordonia sinesedis]
MNDAPMEYPEAAIYAELARVGKALASPVRLRLLDLLEEHEYTVEQLADTAGFGVKNTSSQLQILRAAQLVTTRRDGVHIHYRIANPAVSALLGAFSGFARENVASVRAEIDSYFGDHRDLHPVTADDLAELLADDAVLVIDVRDPEDYRRGHIPGAMSVPQNRIRDMLAELPRDRRIVAYCQGPYCLASPTAAARLAAADLDVTIVDGGITGWIRSGRELHTA